MKRLMIIILVLTMSVANANVVNPLPTVKSNLDGLLKATEGRKTFSEMKKIANDRNTDVDVAFENYIIAKRNVSVARAQFNPITTGHLLGISLGLTYFWAPIAIEAVLSIPTKIYNVSKNKYLEKAALYNLYDARDALNNELAHLYYDILTHEVILKSIDQEVAILTYQQQRWTERKFPADRIADLKKWILRLGMERVDIYSMYTAELAAIKTLISTTSNKYELAQVSTLLNKGVVANIDEANLQKLALVNSDKYKTAINLHRASEQNVKAVKWSILSWSGLNLSYKRRVQEAKNEEVIADLRKQNVEQEVKTNVLLQLSKLDSSIDVFSNYNSISEESLQMFADSFESQQMGLLSEDAVIEVALSAIRDFRNKTVAHYAAWSSFNDFATAANQELVVNPALPNKSVQEQVELNPFYKVDESDYSVVKNPGFNSFALTLKTEKLDTVAEVDYIFANSGLPNRSNDNAKTNFLVTVRGENLPDLVSGVAIVTLKNGHQFNIKFKL